MASPLWKPREPERPLRSENRLEDSFQPEAGAVRLEKPSPPTIVEVSPTDDSEAMFLPEDPPAADAWIESSGPRMSRNPFALLDPRPAGPPSPESGIVSSARPPYLWTRRAHARRRRVVIAAAVVLLPLVVAVALVAIFGARAITQPSLAEPPPQLASDRTERSSLPPVPTADA